jgi:hypothetical protein
LTKRACHRDAANLAEAIACLQIVSPISPGKIRAVNGKGRNIIRILRCRECWGSQRWLHKAATLERSAQSSSEFLVAQASRNGGERGEVLALGHRRNQQEKDEIQHTEEDSRMIAPATIEATRELMAAKGGAADDIGRLAQGEFYFSTVGLSRPIKVRRCA